MKATHDWVCGRGWTKALRAGALVSMALGASMAFAQSDVNGFTADFATNYWTAMPGAGSIYFTNGNTELVLSGPPNQPTPTMSSEPIEYNGPLSGGLTVGGTVQFNYQYYSPYGGDDEADFLYTPPGGSSTDMSFVSGAGPQSGIFSIQLSAGTTFEITLLNDNPGKPLPATLTITNFQFRGDVPEPSAGTLFACVVALSAGARGWRSRRQNR